MASGKITVRYGLQVARSRLGMGGKITVRYGWQVARSRLGIGGKWQNHS